MWERRESNRSSTKENTLICIRAGQASVTYKSAGLHITHRDCYSAFSTIYLYTSYFPYFSLLIAPSFLYSVLVESKSQSLPPNHPTVLRLFILSILSSSLSVHLVICSLIILFPTVALLPLSFHCGLPLPFF